jgi:hypothetical protein
MRRIKRARFTNLIAEPDASEEAVTEAVNDTLKAIAASLLMEQVLAPRFEFKPKATANEPVEGYDYGEGGPNGDNDARLRVIYSNETESDILLRSLQRTLYKDETGRQITEHDATYLLAEVDAVATYKLAGINRNKLEALLHRVFAPAQLDLEIKDRFGNPVKPREWFLVPFHVIDEAVERIRDGSITQVVYDSQSAQLAPG